MTEPRPLTSSAGDAVAKPASASGVIQCQFVLNTADEALREFTANNAYCLAIAQRAVKQIADDYHTATGQDADDLFAACKNNVVAITVDNPVVAKYLLTVGIKHVWDIDLQYKYAFAGATTLQQRNVSRSCLMHVDILFDDKSFQSDYVFVI